MEIIYFIFFIGILGSIIFYSYRYGITPTPTTRKVKERIVTILPQINQGTIAELGSGWGNLAFLLAEHYPSCKINAYEISPIPFVVSKLLALGLVSTNLTFHRVDFFKVSLKHVSLVVCYLYPGAMQRLKSKFESELSNGTYILTHTFAIPGWKPLLIVRADDLYQTPIYLYQFLNKMQVPIRF